MYSTDKKVLKRIVEAVQGSIGPNQITKVFKLNLRKIIHLKKIQEYSIIQIEFPYYIALLDYYDDYYDSPWYKVHFFSKLGE